MDARGVTTGMDRHSYSVFIYPEAYVSSQETRDLMDAV